MKVLHRIDTLIGGLEYALAVLLMAGLIGVVAATVVLRNLLQIPSQTLLEVAPLLVLWLALVGASLALRRGRHIRFEVLMRFLPAAMRRLARVLVGLFGLLVMGLLLFTSFEFVRNEIDLFGLRGWGAVIFPIFFALTGFRFLLQSLEALFSKAAP